LRSYCAGCRPYAPPGRPASSAGSSDTVRNIPPYWAGWMVGSTTGGAVSQRVRLRVNGQTRDLEVEVHDTLLEVLRSEFKLTGPREGCGIGMCGACTVLVDEKPISACL